MKQQTDLTEVLKNGLCIGCGACAVVDNDIYLEINSHKLMYEPSNTGGEKAASICPSIAVDFEWLHEKLFPESSPTSIGVVEKIFVAQSTDYERNVQASSGGLIKEILAAYLDKDEVDGIIALDHVENLLFEPKLITQIEQVNKLPGSIYHNIPFTKALELLKNNTGKYVIVANPCQLEGIYNYIFKHQPELAHKIYSTVGLICGWCYTHHSIKAICEFKKVNFQHIQNISFRGGGPVGELRLYLPNEVVAINRRKDFDYMVAFDRSFNLPRCHLCVNHVNFLADIVVGDAWLASVANTKSGVSLVICRSKATRDIMHKLEKDAKILCVEASEAEIVEAQSRSLTYGDFSYAYLQYLERVKGFRPNMMGTNYQKAILSPEKTIFAHIQENDIKFQLQQQGNYRRLWWRKVIVDSKRYAYRLLKKLFMRVFKPQTSSKKTSVNFKNFR